MSSRLFSGGTDEALPIAWRPAGSPPGPPSVQPASPPDSRMVRPLYRPPTPALEPSVEAQLQDAYQRGRAEGEATANQRAGAMAAPVLENFGAAVRSLADARKQARQEAEATMVQLALAIARRILHREIATDPDAILGLVRSGFDRVNARELHRLRMSPNDAQIVLDNRADLALPPSVEILPDSTLPPGSAIFETTRGELDLSAHTQLEEIERGFTDLIVRSKK